MTSAQFKSIVTMLRSQNLDQVLQAVELIASLGDDELVDRILEGTTFQLGGQRPLVGRAFKHNGATEVIGRVVPGTHFASRPKTLLWDELACLHVLARSSHPLRDEVTHLHLQNHMFGYDFALHLDGLQALPALNALDLRLNSFSGSEVDLAALSQMERLRWLKITHQPLSRDDEFIVPPIDQVSELHLQAWNTTLTSAANLQVLRGLGSIANSSPLTKVTTTTSYEFGAQHLELLPNLEELECHHLHLPDEAVPPLRFVEPAAIHGKGRALLQARVGDVRSLGNLDGLQMLRLMPVDDEELPIGDLLSCSDLRVLDVVGRTTIESLKLLDAHPSLRLIRLAQSIGINKTDVPKSLRGRVTWAESPDFTKAAERPTVEAQRKAKAAAPKVSAQNRKAISRLKKLLIAPNADSIVQGVELAAAMGEAEIFESLTDGVVYEEDEDGGRLVPNKTFSGSGTRQHWLDLSLALLVAASDLPLRHEVRSLRFGQQGYSKTPMDACPIHGLRNYPNLADLTLTQYNAEVDFAAISSFAALTSLTLTGSHVGNSGELTGSPSLRRLKTRGVRLAPDSKWPKLESLDVDVPKFCSDGNEYLLSIEGVRFPKLRTLTLLSRAEVSGVKLLDTIELDGGQIRVRSCPKLRSITGTSGNIEALADTGALEAVSLARTSGPTLASARAIDSISTFAVGTATKVGTVTIPVGASTDSPMLLSGPVEDLGNLGTLGNLQHLTIINQDEPLSLDSLADAKDLRVLDIRGCTGITSLEPLSGLTELRMLAIKNSGVTAVPAPLKHLVSRAAKPDVVAAAQRPKPARPKADAPIPVAEEFRSEWELVLAGLATDSLESALSAVDRAAAIGQDALEFLVGKISARSNRIRAKVPFRLGEPWMAAPVASRLLMHLEGEPKAAQALRHLEYLRLSGKAWSSTTVVAGDLSGLMGLRSLVIDRCRSASIEGLDGMQIEALALRAQHSITIDGGLPKSLTRVLFSRSTPDLGALGNSNVTELFLLESDFVDVSNLRTCPSLTHLHITPRWSHSQIHGIEVLNELPLVELSVRNGVDLTALRGHPSLQVLHLSGWWRHEPDVPKDLKPLVRPASGFSETALDPK